MSCSRGNRNNPSSCQFSRLNLAINLLLCILKNTKKTARFGQSDRAVSIDAARGRAAQTQLSSLKYATLCRFAVSKPRVVVQQKRSFCFLKTKFCFRRCYCEACSDKGDPNRSFSALYLSLYHLLVVGTIFKSQIRVDRRPCIASSR